MGFRNIRTILIAGGGTMGSSMAERYAEYGFQAIIYDISREFLDKAKALIDLHQRTLVEKAGSKSRGEADELIGRISYTTSVEDFSKADFVVESITERIEVKAVFFKQISQHVRDGVIVISNTSALPITELAKFYKDPSRFAGMHWFNPPHIIPLVEVIQGEMTSEETAQLVFELAEFVGKKPVRVRVDAKGFIANRLQFAMLREALHIVDEGIGDIRDVDRCVKYGLGFRYALFGPLEIADFGGLDTFHHISKFLNPDLCDRKDVSPRLVEHFEKGELGIKTGKGLYDYADGRDVAQLQKRDRLYTALYKALYEDQDA